MNDGSEETIRTEQVGVITAEKKRVYHAPRLDDALEYQKKVKKHGKIIAPIITLLGLVLIKMPFGALAVIGLIAYWVAVMNHSSKLEKIEKEWQLQLEILPLNKK